LSRRDWILAGQEMLRECGVSGLKLAPLTRRLGVSTGSFYHHFSDFDAYLGAIAKAFSVDRVQGLLERARAAADDPVGRIKALARLSLEDHTFELDRAMRVWASMDERARVTVRNAEELVLAFLTEAFRDLGFAAGEARLRAGILLSVNIMPLSIQDPKFRPSLFKGALRLLTGQPNA
jgi:AcrR family transcriptional regulator